MRLLNVAPHLKQDDLAHLRLRDAESHRNCRLTHRPRECSNGSHVVCGNAGKKAPLDIRRFRDRLKVVGIDAWRIATQVVKVKTYWNRPSVQFIDGSMSGDESRAIPVRPIPFIGMDTEPEPASGRAVNRVTVKRPLALLAIALGNVMWSAPSSQPTNGLPAVNASVDSRILAHSVLLTLDAVPGVLAHCPAFLLPILPYLGRRISPSN